MRKCVGVLRAMAQWMTLDAGTANCRKQSFGPVLKQELL
jgi:hypothetical protein